MASSTNKKQERLSKETKVFVLGNNIVNVCCVWVFVCMLLSPKWATLYLGFPHYFSQCNKKYVNLLAWGCTNKHAGLEPKYWDTSLPVSLMYEQHTLPYYQPWISSEEV